MLINSHCNYFHRALEAYDKQVSYLITKYGSVANICVLKISHEMEVDEAKIVKRAIQIAEDVFSEKKACW